MKLSLYMLLIAGLTVASGCRPPAPPAPPQSAISIETTPAGASVVLDGREAGLTPLKLNVDHNGHFIAISLAGYRTIYHRIAVGEPLVTELSLPLERQTVALVLQSEPTGASIRVNGQDVGTAPVTLPRQAAGTVQVEMSMSGYSPFSQELTLNDNRPRLVLGTLESTTGALRVATEPGGADIYVDKEFKGRTPAVGGTLRIGDLTEGNHEISARLSGYRDSLLTVLLKRNEDKRVDLPALTKLPGSLKITSVPSAATVLDGSKVLGTTPMSLNDLPPGPLVLTFQLEGFDPVRRTAVVEAGATISIVGVMSRNVGSITLATEPPGCSVYLDRELVGKTVRSGNEQVSRELRIEDLKDGTISIDITHPLYFPETRRIAIKRGETAQAGIISLKRRWIPDYELTKISGARVRGVLIQQSQDGSIIFEEIKGVKIEYGKQEILTLRPLELPTDDVPPPKTRN